MITLYFVAAVVDLLCYVVFLLPCPWMTFCLCFCLLLCFGSLFDTTIKTALGSILFSWSHSVTENMLRLYTSFSEKQSYSQWIYFEMCIRCQNVCFCCGFFFLPNLRNGISTPKIATWKKLIFLQPWKLQTNCIRYRRFYPTYKGLCIHL